jgi:hypothetical protein
MTIYARLGLGSGLGSGFASVLKFLSMSLAVITEDVDSIWGEILGLGLAVRVRVRVTAYG